jgi:hypothetical protein
MSTGSADKSGRVRVRCSTHRESNTCPDPRTYYLDQIERAVLEVLRSELQAPEQVRRFVRIYREERHRLAKTAAGERGKAEQRLNEVNRELDRVTDRLIKGVGD